MRRDNASSFGDVNRTIVDTRPSSEWLQTETVGLALFGLAKALKVWAISSLGSKWSYRVLVVPGDPLVATGPYQLIAHPNYVAGVGEIVSVAAIVWAPITGALAAFGFGWLMILRMRIEDRALGRDRRSSRGRPHRIRCRQCFQASCCRPS